MSRVRKLKVSDVLASDRILLGAASTCPPVAAERVSPAVVLYVVLLLCEPLCGMFYDTDAIRIATATGRETKSALTSIASGFCKVATLVTSLWAIFVGLTRLKPVSTSQPLRITMLWISFLAFWAVTWGRSAWADPVTAIVKPQYWLTPFVVAAACLSPVPTYRSLYGIFQLYVRLVCAVTLAMCFVNPDRVVSYAYEGILPFVQLRLFGFYCHANMFAFLIGMYFLLPRPSNTARSTATRGIGMFCDALCILAFVLSQAKTMYALAMLGLGVKLAVPFVSKSGPAMRVLFAVAILATVTVFSVAPPGDIIEAISEKSNLVIKGGQNLTGRTLVWEIMLREWRDNAWWGHGANVWYGSEWATVTTNGWTWPHAHNQAVQTLWESGVVGFAVLIIHCIVMMNCGWGAIAVFRPGLIAATSVFLLRGSTALSFNICNYASVEYGLHITLLMMYVAASHETGDESLSRQ